MNDTPDLPYRSTIFEMELKKKYPNIDHLEAHKLACEKYHYSMEAGAYYDSLKKHY